MRLKRRDLHVRLLFQLRQARLLDAQASANSRWLLPAFRRTRSAAFPRAIPSRAEPPARVRLLVVRLTSASNDFAMLLAFPFFRFLQFHQMCRIQIVGRSYQLLIEPLFTDA